MPGVIPIRAWSHSRLSVFEQCKLHTKLAVVDRIPEPPRPLPPGKTEHANDRGTRVHTAAELFVKGGVELIHELVWFKDHFEKLRELYAAGRVSLEGEWGFNKSWDPVAWMSDDVWVRIKCDAVVFLDDETAVVIDYKTGKRWGNEAKHAEQMKLYQLAAFLKYPQLKEIEVEIWYIDLDEIVPRRYTRTQGLMFLDGFEQRGLAMTTETEFPPNPNAYSCRWCPYKPKEKGGTGHCKFGV